MAVFVPHTAFIRIRAVPDEIVLRISDPSVRNSVHAAEIRLAFTASTPDGPLWTAVAGRHVDLLTHVDTRFGTSDAADSEGPEEPRWKRRTCAEP